MPENERGCTDGGKVGGHEVILAESKENVGLADPTVPDDEQFGKIVVACILFHVGFIFKSDI
jgi:hypothetical protein